MNSLNGKIQYNTMAYICQLMASDCKVCHWAASGLHFTDIHELADEYASYAREQSDWFAERAIMHGQELDNMTNIRDHITELQWPSLKLVAYDFDLFLDKILERGEVMVQCLESVDDLGNSDERSIMDEYLNFWRLEIEYKDKMRKGAPEEKGVLQDIQTDVNLPKVDNDYKGTVFAVVRSPHVTKAGLANLPTN